MRAREFQDLWQDVEDEDISNNERSVRQYVMGNRKWESRSSVLGKGLEFQTVSIIYD
jgi:hypothetical protein